MDIETRKLDVQILDPNGNIIFEKKNFEVPIDWSDRAAQIVASKYAMDNEFSAVQIIDRVVNQIGEWGWAQGYFDNNSELHMDKATIEFKNKLREILISQRAAFNSPVWFNCGSDTGTNQMSACFIVPVEDTMESILEHNTIEGKIFRGGSGAGCNVSSLRAKGEKLSNKGTASGPLSFMNMWDCTAGAIRSGGKTRRSAKLICMDVDHPDVMDFIECKKHEENKAKALIEAGIPVEEAYATVSFQNTNHSIRVSDGFMKAVEAEDDWSLVNRGNGEVANKIPAVNILNRTAQIAWATGDPGIQFDSRMNIDNPVPSLGKINSTNPCSEFSAVDNSSCNLASMNLIKYLDDNTFNYYKFEQDIKIMITAMDILIDAADYPTEDIKNTTKITRPLGLGFSNLGASLMVLGISYDSDEGRKWAAEITKEMTRYAYKQSNQLAKKLGSYEVYNNNLGANYNIIERLTEDKELASEINATGLRNSQVTLLAPTGTISFMMDCDTTGIEPLFALQSIKTLAGGGIMKIDYPCVEQAARNIISHWDDIAPLSEAIKACPDIFKTANEIPWKAHIDMMAACQKHLNGAISKTVNMPADITAEQISEAYKYAWKAGLKAIAIYRDGSKGMQPITDATKKKEDKIEKHIEPQWSAVRKQLPRTRDSLTHAFNISGFEGYFTVGLYDDGSPGEMFINMQKQGSTLSGLMDSFAVLLSFALQYGVPLERLISKFRGTKFEPAGVTNNPDIWMTTSVMDYIFRWLDKEFFDAEDEEEEVLVHKKAISEHTNLKPIDASGPACIDCGHTTILNGTCYQCLNCGTTTGCS